MELFYKQPAGQWEDCLVMGNGSMGAMAFGKTDVETIGLNHDTLWSGTYRDKNDIASLTYLAEARRLIFSGKQHEAFLLMNQHMLGAWTESYLQLGFLEIDFGHKNVSNYRRSLDLDNAVQTISYTAGGASYSRQMLVSAPHKVFVLRLCCDSPVLSFTLTAKSLCRFETHEADGSLVLCGKAPSHVEPDYVGEVENAVVYGGKSLSFMAQICPVYCDGRVFISDSALCVDGARQCTLYITFDTDFRGEICCKTPTIGFDELLAAHAADYQALFGRVDVDFGPQLSIPTDRRLQNLRAGGDDPGLFALYLQFSRYLTISSSRPGSQAANLQGIWSWQERAPWACNYTTNINVEMNYWPCLAGNLAECMEPYFNLIEEMAAEGRKTAQKVHGCRGFCAHHNSDLWRMTSPAGGDARHSYWPMALGWMARDMWEFYCYTQDEGFLENRALPILEGCALFFCDWLVEHDGFLVTCPSTSPENVFLDENKNLCGANYAGAMDMTIVREVFDEYAAACRVLGIESELLDEVATKRERLAPYAYDENGMLLEFYENFEMPEPGHRHLSAVYGLYPGCAAFSDGALFEGAKKLFENRLANGDSGVYSTLNVGWSCAWISLLWARLKNGEEAYASMRRLLTNSTLDSLLDTFPPFQIDGNFGGGAALLEMLVQSHEGCIHLLPALPKAFSKGHATGLRARGGAAVSLWWENGRVTRAEINPCNEAPLVIKYNGKTVTVKGETTLV